MFRRRTAETALRQCLVHVKWFMGPIPQAGVNLNFPVPDTGPAICGNPKNKASERQDGAPRAALSGELHGDGKWPAPRQLGCFGYLKSTNRLFPK